MRDIQKRQPVEPWAIRKRVDDATPDDDSHPDDRTLHDLLVGGRPVSVPEAQDREHRKEGRVGTRRGSHRPDGSELGVSLRASQVERCYRSKNAAKNGRAT